VKSDLAMVKPIALRMFNLNPVEFDEMIGEVESRLLEEADYKLELNRSIELSKACKHIPHLHFPNYYPQFSGDRILTMDWIEGHPLGERIKRGNISKEEGNRIGQAMWDFYHFQIHTLRQLHADPHPGNFIIDEGGKLGVIDFGCVKVIPSEFYSVYFQLLDKDILKNHDRLMNVFYKLRFIYPDDSEEDKKFFTEVFTHLVELLGRPFQSKYFDFSNQEYFQELYKFGDDISKMKAFRNSKKARGVKDALYINRTYYGLYNLLHQLNATIDSTSYVSFKP
jgi:predicted unusual protein kinase regulating ubiquinone biosynthesis (AarF/ABC1/UbiB family)